MNCSMTANSDILEVRLKVIVTVRNSKVIVIKLIYDLLLLQCTLNTQKIIEGGTGVRPLILRNNNVLGKMMIIQKL